MYEMASARVAGKNQFLSQVERVRVELRERVARAHQVLQERETALLSELQQLEDTYMGEGVDKQIDQLRTHKEQTIATLTDNENKEFLEQSVAQLDTRMRELEANLETARDRMIRVELEWDGNLEGILSSTGSIRVREEPDYKEKGNPVMVAGKHRNNTSSTPGEFCYPNSIAIDSETNNIYVCDGWNDRVQVFNESLEFLFTFSDKMNIPHGICINLNRVYITQYSAHSLTVYSTEGKCIESVGREGNKELKFSCPTGVAVSTAKNLIYICELGNNRIQCLTLNLSFNSFIPNVTYARDIKLTPEDIVVLTDGSLCIRFYDYFHQLIREIIIQGKVNQVINPQYFCLDREFNILMTDCSACSVMIFSNKGQLLRKVGKRGEERGNFIFPTGIATDRDGKIIVVTRNPKYCIQMV